MVIIPVNRFTNFREMDGVNKCVRYIFIERRHYKDEDKFIERFGKTYVNNKIEKSGEPIIIINDSEMVTKNRKTKERELVVSTNIYLGEIYRSNKEKFSFEDSIIIKNCHYNMTFKPLEENYDKPTFVENYCSYDHNIRYDYRERIINNDYDKIDYIKDPSPMYYNHIHQNICSNYNESFLYRLYQETYHNDKEGIRFLLKDLFDENTKIGYFDTNIFNLINLASKIHDSIGNREINSFYSPSDMISRIYTLFSNIKYDLESYCIQSADIIFTTDRGWSIKNIKMVSKELSDDNKTLKYLLELVMFKIQNRYGSYFIPELRCEYEYDLFMHFSSINNTLKISFHNNIKGFTNISLDGILEEVSTSKIDDEERYF